MNAFGMLLEVKRAGKSAQVRTIFIFRLRIELIFNDKW